jgi:hypothetical protein
MPCYAFFMALTIEDGAQVEIPRLNAKASFEATFSN